MDDVIPIIHEEPELDSPIMIEGLPGVGNVGKLAAEHILDQVESVQFVDIYSKHFPPQVTINDDGVTEMVSNQLHYAKDVNGQDIIFLTGDYQGLTPEGQYELSYFVFEVAKKYGVKRIYTLGGYGIGKMVEQSRVLGATTSLDVAEEMKGHGVEFSKDEPGSGIVGASGLLLGFGGIFGIEAVCLMGETSGYFVDPRGAESIVKVLGSVLDVEFDLEELKEKAEQIELITSKLKEIETPAEPKREDLGYIG